MGNVSIGDARKAEFMKWLIEKTAFSHSSLAKYIERLQKASSYVNKRIFEIDEVDNLKQLHQSIIKTLYFKRLGWNDQISLMTAFNQYLEFLSQWTIEQIHDEMVEAASTKENADNARELNYNSLITAVLRGELYQPLIEALHHDKIDTMGQLIDINLFFYLNSKSLYSWKERLAVLEGLKVLLDPYRKNFKKGEIVQITNRDASVAEEQVSTVTANNGLHKVDIRDKKNYMHMKPQKFILQGKEFDVTSWKEVLTGVCEELFKFFPSQMAILIDQSIGRGGHPLFGRNRNRILNGNKLSNGLYINVQFSAYGILNNVEALCQKCGIGPNELEIFVKSKKENRSTGNNELHKSDIIDKKNYVHKKNQKFVLEGKELDVTSWNEVLIGVCEELFKRFPSQMAALIDQPVYRGGLPLFVRNKNFLYTNKLSNGFYVDSQLSESGVLNNIEAICQKFGIQLKELEIFVKNQRGNRPKSNMQDEPATQLTSIVEETSSRVSVSPPKVDDIAENINSGNLVSFPQPNNSREATDSFAATVMDDEYLYGLRDEFRNYIRQQHPEWADATVDMHKSDAYFLKNNDVGIGLTEAFANEEALLVARDKIRDYLRDVNKVGNSENGANGYLRTMRMFKEFLLRHPDPVTTLTKDNFDLAVIDKVADVISTCFANGFRLNSSIELSRFRTFYANELGEEISLSDEELNKYIVASGSTFDGKVYSVSSETKEQIKGLVENYFDDGAQAIFYAEFYAKNENWLFDESVISEDMLVGILREVFPRLSFTQTYFGYTTESVFNVLESEILRVWGDDVLLTYAQLAERLEYVPIERIKYALGQNADFIWNNTGEFTHVSKIDITEDETTEIVRFADAEIRTHKYASIAYAPLGEIPEKNYALSVTAIHNSLYHICLSRNYEQHGKIITRKGYGIDAKSIMEEHCRTLDRCTLDDLLEFEKDLTGECHRWIPMEAGYAVMVRTDENAFVAERYVDFDKSAIDKAIDQFVNGGEYTPLRAVTTFALFPHCRQPWNLFLLESYCRRFSDNFRFEVLSVNSTNAGVVVRKHSRLTYFDIMADAVAKSGISLNEKTVLNFLATSGYTSQRRYAKIVELIKQATALRA